MAIRDLHSNQSILSNYRASELDDSGTTNYFGFLTREAEWYILELDNTNGTLRYIRGDSDLATNWTNRASLNYQTFDLVF